MVRPKLNAAGEEQLDLVEDQIKKSVEVEVDRTIASKETEPQTKIAQVDLEKSSIRYLKPKRTFPSKEKFNEKFRDEYNQKKEYVEFIAENNEVKGETIDLCLKLFPGMSVEEWVIPVNIPVSAPKYVRDRLDECGYTVFVTNDTRTGKEEGVTYYGQLVAEERRQRLCTRDISRSKRINMGHRIFN